MSAPLHVVHVRHPQRHSSDPAAGGIGAPSIADDPVAWRIDPAQSRIRFVLRHFIVATVQGGFREVTGVVDFDERDSRTPLIDVRIPVASLATGAPRRDARLLAPDFLDAAFHPTISFAGRGLHGDPMGTCVVTGDLTIRGTTRAIVVHATAMERDADAAGRLARVTYHASVRFDRRDFGLMARPFRELSGLVMGRAVRVEIEVSLVRLPVESQDARR